MIDSVIVDLKAAVTDLEGRDPIFDPLYQATTGSDMYMWTQPMPDRNEFLSYRGFRLNYYAVNALLARVYAYKLDKNRLTIMLKLCWNREYSNLPIIGRLLAIFNIGTGFYGLRSSLDSMYPG